MPIGRKVPQRLKTRIREVFLEMRERDPKTNATMVAYEIRKEEQARSPNTSKEWPSDSTVRKVIATVRKLEAERQSVMGVDVDLDERPWTLRALAFCDIPPEAVPDIMREWVQNAAYRTASPVTIREAKWIARLRHFGFRRGSNDLYRTAKRYARSEYLSTLEEYPTTREDAFEDWSADLDALASTQIDREDFFRAFDTIHERTPHPVRDELREKYERRFGIRKDPVPGT